MTVPRFATRAECVHCTFGGVITGFNELGYEVYEDCEECDGTGLAPEDVFYWTVNTDAVGHDIEFSGYWDEGVFAGVGGGDITNYAGVIDDIEYPDPTVGLFAEGYYVTLDNDREVFVDVSDITTIS